MQKKVVKDNQRKVFSLEKNQTVPDISDNNRLYGAAI
jgi:hypothetical protein